MRTRAARGRRDAQEGQSIVILALMMGAMLGMLGLGLDGGRIYLDYRSLQNAADAGSLAGADTLKFHTQSSARQKAIAEIVANLPGTADPGTENYGADITNLSIGKGYTVSVTITTSNGTSTVTAGVNGQLNTTVIQALGAPANVTVGTNAAALAGNPPFTPAVIGLAPCGSNPYGVAVSGSGNLTVSGAIQSNGDVYIGNTATLNADGNIYSVCNINGTPNYGAGDAGYPGSPRLGDPGYPSPQPLPTNNQGSLNLSGASTDPVEWAPGLYSSIKVSGGCYFVDAGIYDFTGTGYDHEGGYISNELYPPGSDDGWAGAGCTIGSISAAPSLATPALGSGTYYMEVTSYRIDNGDARESVPSTCFTASTQDNLHSFTITVPNIPGAQGYNLYASAAGCGGPFAQVASQAVSNPGGETQGNMGTTTLQYLKGAGTGSSPPSGDMANENYSVGSGFNQVTPGGVSFVMAAAATLNQQGGAGLHIFSGYQYNWLVVWRGAASGTDPTCIDKLVGGSSMTLIGTYYSPTCEVDAGGSSTASIQGQLVAYNVVFTGNSGNTITYDSQHSAGLAARLTH
jgi:Flp pilus assembly protein TadG